MCLGLANFVIGESLLRTLTSQLPILGRNAPERGISEGVALWCFGAAGLLLASIKIEGIVTSQP